MARELGNGRTLLFWNDTRWGGGILEGSLYVWCSGFSLVEGIVLDVLDMPTLAACSLTRVCMPR